MIMTLLFPIYPLHKTRTAPFAHVMSLLLHCISVAFVLLLRISTRAFCVVAVLCAKKV